MQKPADSNTRRKLIKQALRAYPIEGPADIGTIYSNVFAVIQHPYPNCYVQKHGVASPAFWAVRELAITEGSRNN